MGIVKIILILILTVLTVTVRVLDQNILAVQNKNSPIKTQQAVLDLIHRVFPSIVNIKVEIDPVYDLNDAYFELSTSLNAGKNVEIFLRASSAPTALYGLHKYLMDYCNITFTLVNSGNRTINLKHITNTITRTPGNTIMFYGNPCVFSYSYWFWDWKMWERHIDWIILRGFNLVLLPIGTEFVLVNAFSELGMKNIDKFFTGQAWLAWSRMGNLKKLRGPLSDNLIRSQFQLQKLVMKRMNKLGLAVVLPAFSGFVPQEITELYPNESFINVSCWLSFNTTNSCLTQINPATQFFQKVGSLYMKYLTLYFGTNHIYSGDMFNENTPTNSSLKYLTQAGRSMSRVLLKSDQKSVWVLQSWSFGYDDFWTNDRIAAYLSEVPQQNMLILDMFAESKPMWKKTNSFFGKQFIWVMINNFGGNTVINGNIRDILDGIFYAKSQSTLMLGTGFMPEGINQNPLLLDLFSRYSWEFAGHIHHNEKFLLDWRKRIPFYRYNINNRLISQSVKLTVTEIYVDTEERYYNSCIIYKRPDFNYVFVKSSKDFIAVSAIENILLYLGQNSDLRDDELGSNLLLDLVNLVRDVSERKFYLSYESLINSYYESDLQIFNKCYNNMKVIIEVLENVTSILQHLRLSCYLEKVKNFAFENDENEDKLIYDFLLQITLWGENGEISDYAFKLWSGMLDKFYLQRWNIFVKFLYLSLIYDVQFPTSLYDKNMFAFEKDFVSSFRNVGDCKSQNPVDVDNILYKVNILLSLQKC